MLWNFHPGHRNFQYMKYFFPNLFNKVDAPSLSFNVYICAKQQRVTFPSQLGKPFQLFTLIHSDV